MAVTQKVTLYNNKFTVPPVINAVQNDTDRQVEAYFGDFTLQVGMTGKLSFIRSDLTHYEVSATLNTGANTATAELDQALTQAGVTQAQLKITDSGNVGSTFTFMIKVQPDVAGISQQQDGWSVQEIMDDIADAATAAGTSYDNTASGLSATDVQNAIDELASEKQDALTAGDGITISSDTISTDNDATLTSETKPAQAKAVGDALSAQETATEEALYTKAPVIVDTASGSIVSFPDGADGYPLKECAVDVDAVQDLHGYDNPWPAGGGKNLVNVSDVANITTQTVVMADTSLSAGTYTISVYISNSGTAGAAIRIFVNNTAVKTSDYVTSSTKTRVSATVTLSQTSIVKVAVVGSASGYNASLTDFQLEVGSIATTFAPYANICPITGWSEAKVTMTGINVWDEVWEEGSLNGSGANYSSSTAIRSTNYIPIKPNTNYTIFSSGNVMKIRWYNFDKNFLSAPAWTSGVQYKTFTSPADAYYLRFATADGYGNTYQNNLSVNYPETDTAYHTYNGTIYPISWQSSAGTVYGGTLDVTRGKLTVTHAYKVLNGTETWYAITSPANGFRNSGSTDFPGRKSGGEFICNRLYDKGNSLSDLTNTWDAVFSSNLNIRTDSLFADADAFKTWVASNNLECVYELDTPVEVDLTATDITTLLGTNNVWADCGDIEVEYCADTKKYIQKVISALA